MPQQTAQPRRLVLAPVPADHMAAVDALRAPFYAQYNQPMTDPPGLTWYGCFDRDTSELLACAALGPSTFSVDRKTMYDLLGNNAQAIEALSDGLIDMVRQQGLGLTAWMPLDHQSRITYAMKRGFKPTAILLDLAPVVEPEAATA